MQTSHGHGHDTHAHGHGDSSHDESPGGHYTVVKMDIGVYERLYVPAIAAGLVTTARHFFRNVFAKKENKYIATIQYPDEKVPYARRFRGMHRLVPRDDGKPRCVACFMCQTACPARCINIVGGETPDNQIEKFPIVFEIDELRCVVCGLCVEACPCDAIRMDTDFHPRPVESREAGLFGKHDLLSIYGRDERGRRDPAAPPPTAAGKGRVDRSSGDGGAGGSRGGY